MMLEAHLDKIAYPTKTRRLKISEETAAKAMAELAKLEGNHRRAEHREYSMTHVLRNRGVREERTLKALAKGPMTRKQLAEALGISYHSTADYLRPLLKDGRAKRYGEGKRVEEFGLP